MSFTPSDYQRRIFAFAREDGNGFVNAVAGSGKTSTSVLFCHELPMHLRDRTAFFAFNKHIKETLAERLPHKRMARTVHSQGWQLLRDHFEIPSHHYREWVVENKYARLADKWWGKKAPTMPWKRRRLYVESTIALIDKCRLTLTDPSDLGAMETLAARYGIDTLAQIEELCLAVCACIKRGGEMLSEQIDFGDMIYWPNIIDMDRPSFDWLIVDEAQDLNSAQRELLLTLISPKGRSLWVGDPKQSVYGFMGADNLSIPKIVERTSAIALPLSVCYRCPTSHLELARALVPHIEDAPGAQQGIVRAMDADRIYQREDPDGEDLILCRTTAPLISQALRLLGRKIPCVVKGRDIGQGLVDLVRQVEGYADYSWDCFPTVLREIAGQMVATLQRQEGSALTVDAYLDRVQSVMTLYTRARADGVRDAEGLEAFIMALFDEQQGVVTLSTIHRAKGLEAPRVFLLHPELMPHPKAMSDEELEQEQNLKYVALTRAKEELVFLSGEDEEVC